MSSKLPDAQLDTDLLIEEVKARPCLYARDSLRYGDANYKRNEWENVTQILFENVWSTYDAIEKAEKVELVQKRWKNLRACFTREIKRQKDPNWIFGVAYKRRKYMYYNALSFLKSESDGTDEDAKQDIDLPVKTDSDSTTVTVDTNIEEIFIPEPPPVPKSKAKTNRIKAENNKSASNSDNTNSLLYSEDTKTSAYSDDTETPTNYDITCTSSNSDSEAVSYTQSHTNAKNQNSTNFALSLVPMLDMIPIDERVEAQIEILSILQPFLKRARDVKKRRKSSREKSGRQRMDTISIELKREEENQGERAS